METIKECDEKKRLPDDVDFTSGYEAQYATEYAKKPNSQVSPPDPKNAWYRDLTTIFMIMMLLFVFLAGSVLLITLVFTTNPWQILVITSVYIIVALVYIYGEIYSKHVR